MILAICSCGFKGQINDLFIDDNSHRVYYCPDCHLAAGLTFQEIGKTNMGYETSIVHPWIKKEILKRFPKAYIYKPRAGTYGKKGIADFLCCINGLFIAIEAKADRTKKVTPLQKIELQKVHEAGGLRYSVFGKDMVVMEEIFFDITINSPI